MKQTAIQQAITMVRSRMESIDETLMGKHTIHHLQQVERGLYELLEMEKTNTDNKVIHFAEWLTKKHTTVLMTLYEQFEEQCYNETYNGNK